MSSHYRKRIFSGKLISLLILTGLVALGAGCGPNPFNVAPVVTPSRLATPFGVPTGPVVVVTATSEPTSLSEIPTITPTNVAAPNLTTIPPTNVPVPTFTPLPSLTSRPATPVPTLVPASIPTSIPKITQVQIFLIAIEDGGKSGPKIGCNDSVVGVRRAVAPTNAPLTAALNELLSLHTQFYGQSGLYNALYQSNLQISSVTIVNGRATIKLTGALRLGGECDDPRVEAQLTQTALQFPTVRAVDVFINDRPLKSLLGGKGE